jgi:hypothetical protein
VSLSFASCDPSTVPIWLAVQSGNGAWTRVTAGANNTFTFTPGATGGIAYVTADAAGFKTTQVLYGTAAEITAIATGPGPCSDLQTGTKRVNGTETHPGGPAIQQTVSIGGAETTWTAFSGAGYSLRNVPAGRRDVVAFSSTTAANGDTQLQRMIIRRNVEYANNATVPDLDLIGGESFAPVQHPITFTNLAGDKSGATVSFVTTNGGSSYFSGAGRFLNGLSSDGVGVYGIPDSLLQSGDFHLASVFASAKDGKSFRVAQWSVHSLGNRAITFGPALAPPSVTSLGTTPYLRPRVQLPLQSEYNGGASAEYDQGGNKVEVSATAGYFTGAPASWVIDVPDLTSAGYDPAWGLKGGTTLSWLVSAAGGNVLPFLGAPLVDGAQIVAAGTSSDAASFNVLGDRMRARHRTASSTWKPFSRFQRRFTVIPLRLEAASIPSVAW